MKDVRHAHSHIGYFAVLFPLAWLALQKAGARVPSSRFVVAYLVASLVAFAGFMRTGYGPEAIAGSTVVGLGWIYAAWLDRGAMKKLNSWRGGIPVAILAASALVPPIALFTRRDPLFAQALVEGFLTILLLGVIVPAALAARGVKTKAWPLWSAAVLLLGAGVGPVDHPALTLLGAILISGQLTRSRGDIQLSRVELVLWLALALGLYLPAFHDTHHVGMAGVHFAILGPVLIALLQPRPAWWNLAWAASAAAMAAAILLQRQTEATVIGGLLIILAVPALYRSTTTASP
jgi:hypothetical protein